MNLIKILCFVFLMNFVSFTGKAQIPFKVDKVNYKIVYAISNNGKMDMRQPRILVYANAVNTLLTNEKDIQKNASLPIEFSITQATNLSQTLYSILNETNSISTIDATAIKNQKIEFLNDTKKILGYQCKKAKSIVITVFI